MPYYYHLSSDGTAQRRVAKPSEVTLEDISIKSLNPKYKGDVYMHCISDEENIFLLMHDDNDFQENLGRSHLYVNRALQKYFPNSHYVGDMILVISDDNDRITSKEWNIEILRKYVLEDWEDLEEEDSTMNNVFGVDATSSQIVKKKMDPTFILRE